jgi:hypothetical protein
MELADELGAHRLERRNPSLGRLRVSARLPCKQDANTKSGWLLDALDSS